PEAADELGAVKLRHLEIGNDEVGLFLGCGSKRGQRIVEGPHHYLIGKRPGESLKNLQIRDAIIDDRDDLASHGLATRSPWPGRRVASRLRAHRHPCAPVGGSIPPTDEYHPSASRHRSPRCLSCSVEIGPTHTRGTRSPGTAFAGPVSAIRQPLINS